MNLAKVPKIAFALNSLKPVFRETEKFNLCQTVSHPLLQTLDCMLIGIPSS